MDFNANVKELEFCGCFWRLFAQTSSTFNVDQRGKVFLREQRIVETKMRPKFLLWAILVVGVAFAIEHTMADIDGLIDIDGDFDDRESQNSEKKYGESSNGKGDDEDDYGASAVMSDESGSGSGEEATTEEPIVDVSVVGPTTEKATTTTEKTTTINNEITEGPEEPTEDEMSEAPTDGNEDDDGNMVGGGISETDAPDDESPKAEAKGRLGQADEKSVLRVLTTEVIAAVVVGAVCAVILIAFLVYRLRKRDEGSYALSDMGYKDTYKLQADTGKEAFV